MSLVDSQALTSITANPVMVLPVISLLAAGAVSVVGYLSVLLARTRAAQDATKAAHAASGQGSILVDGQMKVLETNAAAQALLWPNLAAGKALSLSTAIRDLLADDDEQHHLLTVGGERLIEIELTESLLLADDDSTALTLRDLRSIGVRVALDDFGTGYSALTYLNRFPLDVVKMDRGFLRDIEDSDTAAGIAAAVVSMSHSLGFEVIAEGVDSPLQADLLRKMGCNQIQGFLFSPAIPSEEATRFLASDGMARPRIEPIIPTGGRRSIAGGGATRIHS